MLTRLRQKLSYANVTATLALFIALGGTSYAALTLPRNSVGSKQIRSRAVGVVGTSHARGHLASRPEPVARAAGSLEERARVAPRAARSDWSRRPLWRDVSRGDPIGRERRRRQRHRGAARRRHERVPRRLPGRCQRLHGYRNARGRQGRHEHRAARGGTDHRRCRWRSGAREDVWSGRLACGAAVQRDRRLLSTDGSPAGVPSPLIATYPAGCRVPSSRERSTRGRSAPPRAR